jgi:opacity protein-like surface antigen
MKTKYALHLIFTIALVCMTSPVIAQDKSADYVALKAGVYSPSESYHLREFNGSTESHLDSKTGFNGELAFGHYVLPMFAIELGAGYFESEGSPAAEPGKTKLKVVPVLVSGKVLIPIGQVVEPYGEFGIGAYFTKLDVDGNLGNFSGSSKITYGLHAGIGINFNISETSFLGVEGRYLWAKPSYGGQDIKLDGFTATAVLGFRM